MHKDAPQPHLAVIIVNYNVRYFLHQCLSSVHAAISHAAANDFIVDCWVVDNASADDSVQMVSQHFPWVKLIANTKNSGFSTANNQAIRLADSQYVLLLNPDTVLGEQVLSESIQLMDANQKIGALGARMVDGSGTFLPESKRGLPTPAVALFKLIGLAKLFPKSKKFGRYHLGFLDEHHPHEIDILPGAFMMLRKAALVAIGLLDEDFFMYGEDVDLSYRLQKGGWQNWYMPQLQIIHYKGESTKKGSANYVRMFYLAMAQFAWKHFGQSQAKLHRVIIQFGIWTRAGLAIAERIVARLTLPLMDYSIGLGLLLALVTYWERTIKYVHGGGYPDLLTHALLPIAMLLWVLGFSAGSAYSSPITLSNTVRGGLIGTAIVALVYAFLPEEHRYSRALVALGGVLVTAAAIFARFIFLFAAKNQIGFSVDRPHGIIFAGNGDDWPKAKSILDSGNTKYRYLGNVSPDESPEHENHLGPISRLAELATANDAREIIYGAQSLSYSRIIQLIQNPKLRHLEQKILPAGADFIIGSHSKNVPGDYYAKAEKFSITQPAKKAAKRAFDMVVAAVCLIVGPLTCWLTSSPGRYFTNLILVLAGKFSIIGYAIGPAKCPPTKTGLLSPADLLTFEPDNQTLAQIDFLYARDWHWGKDLRIFIHSFSKLSRQIDLKKIESHTYQ